MDKKYKNFVVVDFEATCTEDNFDTEFRAKQEIIEFGICVVDSVNLEIINKQSVFVKPVFNPKLTSFCTNLTGITQNQVDNGLPFVVALERFKETLTDYNIDTFCSWGDFDWKLLAKNCVLHKQINPLDKIYITNVKQFAGAWYEDRPCGVQQRLQKQNLKFIGSPHSGIDDAINITRILKKIQDSCPIPIVEAFDLFADGGSGALVQYKFANADKVVS